MSKDLRFVASRGSDFRSQPVGFRGLGVRDGSLPLHVSF